MFKVRVDIVCPCGKLHSSRTIRSEIEKALGSVVCSRCKRRFEETVNFFVSLNK